jgi:adenosylhomocysteinase
MDMSFAVQFLSALYVLRNHDKLEKRVIDVSADIDDLVARRALAAYGVKIDSLTEEQEKYLGSWIV